MAATELSIPPNILSTPLHIDEEHEYSIVHTGTRRSNKKILAINDDDEPLIDTTAVLPLHSKKTKRLEKQLQKRRKKHTVTSEVQSFLDLPPELLHEILAHLRPSDLFKLSRVSRSTLNFISEHERTIASDVIRTRYWVLRQCFPLPVPYTSVDEHSKAVLLNPTRLERMNAIHNKPYQHIRAFDPLVVCTCSTCVFGWNNLCLALDLAHFQTNLDQRQPIPMIPRGSQPEWNQSLIESNAAIVETAIKRPLYYAAILEKHLRSISSTLMRPMRQERYRRPKDMVKPHSVGSKSDGAMVKVSRARQYDMTEADAITETDTFLERRGPASLELPFHRDNYYALQAYVPNRKWSEEESRWRYYGGMQHEADLALARRWYKPHVAS